MQSSRLSIAVAASACGFMLSNAAAQFSSGSNGSYGPLNLGQSENPTLQVPPDGIFHCTTITMLPYANLKFIKNAANTPVYLLATGDIIIDRANIIVEGKGGTALQAGIGGPGGFDGGSPPLPGQSAAGWGAGPGGGKPGSLAATAVDYVGFGSYATKRIPTPGLEQLNHGPTYGSALLVPLVGGSGGGGAIGGGGGGGGGGALLLSSSTSISLNTQNGVGGVIYAYGGHSNATSSGGSGGAVRFVSPRVIFAGQPIIFADHEEAATLSGNGRIRVDTLDASRVLGETTRIYGSFSVGKNMMIFPPNLPTLEIIEAAGLTVNPAQSATLSLPSGIPTQQPVKVRATNFGGVAKLKVVLTPERGPQQSYDLDITNPGPDAAVGTATVEFPGSALTRIDVWTR